MTKGGYSWGIIHQVKDIEQKPLTWGHLVAFFQMFHDAQPIWNQLKSALLQYASPRKIPTKHQAIKMSLNIHAVLVEPLKDSTG